MESIKEEKKQTAGRQKIAIKKIEDPAKLQVTFSKRKGGLFRKASELSIVCGVDVAVIVFSPAGKAFASGHPTPEHIIDRFLNNGEANGRLPRIHEGDELFLCQQRDKEIQKELEAEKAEKEKKGRFLEMLMDCNSGSSDVSLWDAYIDGLSLAELEQLRSDMEQLMKDVEKRCEERIRTDVDSFSWLMTVPDSDVNAVDAGFLLDGKPSSVASSSSSPMTAQDSGAYAVAHADDGFDFKLDGQLSNYVASSSSSSMTTPDSDVNAAAADDSSNLVLDVNPITVDDPFEFLNIDVPDLLEIEWC